MLDFVILSFVALTVLWFVYQYLKERRTLWLGVSFIAAVMGLLSLLALITIRFPQTQYWILFGLAFTLGPIIIFFPLTLISTMIISGINLIRKEGASLSHILSLGFGILYIIYLVIWPNLENAFENDLFEFIYVYLSFCFLFTLSIFALYTITNFLNLIKVPRKKYKYIIVLGSGLRDGVEVTPLLAGRVDKGIEAHRQNEGSILILSGGRGADEKVSEGEAMKRYALQQGVAKSNILVEEQSSTTRENLLFSQAVIEDFAEKGNILVVTTRYHVLRAVLLAKNLGIRCDGGGSKTKLYFSVSDLIREWIAYLVIWRKKYVLSFANQLFYNRTSVCIFLWVLKVKGYLHMKLYEV